MDRGAWSVPWLESSLGETMLPGSPWDSLDARVGAAVRAVVSQRLERAEVRQVLFALLGDDFVRTHFPNAENNALILEEPYMPSDMRRHLFAEMSKWLSRAIDAELERLDLLASHEAAAVRAHVEDAVRRGLNREVSLRAAPGEEGETVARAVCALLRQQPRHFARVAKKLTGRPLPSSLRQYVWLQATDDRQYALRFAQKVSENVRALGIESPTSSPISGLIRRVTEEIHARSSAMRTSTTPQLRDATAAVLNILYVHSAKYEARYIQLAYPLLRTFPAAMPETAAPLLSRFLEQHALDTRAAAAMAEQVIARVAKADPSLHGVMDKAAADASVGGQDFLVRLAELVGESAPDARRGAADGGRSVLSRPSVFVRKWILEGFVGTLSQEGVMYVWDQCFLGGWRQEMPHVCTGVLFLLRRRIIAAVEGGFEGLRYALVQAPAELKPDDIRRAYIHVRDGGDLRSVPWMDSTSGAGVRPPRHPGTRDYDTSDTESSEDEKRQVIMAHPPMRPQDAAALGAAGAEEGLPPLHLESLELAEREALARRERKAAKRAMEQTLGGLSQVAAATVAVAEQKHAAASRSHGHVDPELGAPSVHVDDGAAAEGATHADREEQVVDVPSGAQLDVPAHGGSGTSSRSSHHSFREAAIAVAATRSMQPSPQPQQHQPAPAHPLRSSRIPVSTRTETMQVPAGVVVLAGRAVIRSVGHIRAGELLVDAAVYEGPSVAAPWWPRGHTHEADAVGVQQMQGDAYPHVVRELSEVTGTGDCEIEWCLRAEVKQFGAAVADRRLGPRCRMIVELYAAQTPHAWEHTDDGDGEEGVRRHAQKRKAVVAWTFFDVFSPTLGDASVLWKLREGVRQRELYLPPVQPTCVHDGTGLLPWGRSVLEIVTIGDDAEPPARLPEWALEVLGKLPPRIRVPSERALIQRPLSQGTVHSSLTSIASERVEVPPSSPDGGANISPLEPIPYAPPDGIDLYVDYGSHFPASVVVSRVAVEFRNSKGQTLPAYNGGRRPVVAATCTLDSEPLFPVFNARCELRHSPAGFDVGTVACITVTCIDSITKRDAVLGSCVLPLFGKASPEEVAAARADAAAGQSARDAGTKDAANKKQARDDEQQEESEAGDDDSDEYETDEDASEDESGGPPTPAAAPSVGKGKIAVVLQGGHALTLRHTTLPQGPLTPTSLAGVPEVPSARLFVRVHVPARSADGRVPLSALAVQPADWRAAGVVVPAPPMISRFYRPPVEGRTGLEPRINDRVRMALSALQGGSVAEALASKLGQEFAGTVGARTAEMARLVAGFFDRDAVDPTAKRGWLSVKKPEPPQLSPAVLSAKVLYNMARVVPYDPASGLALRVESVSGLLQQCHTNAFVRVIGTDGANVGNFWTARRDFESPIDCVAFVDEPTLLAPPRDPRLLAIVEVLGISPPKSNDGVRSLVFQGWSAVPLVSPDGDYVLSGLHVLPLYSFATLEKFLAACKNYTPHELLTCDPKVRRRLKPVEWATVALRVVDGQFFDPNDAQNMGFPATEPNRTWMDPAHFGDYDRRVRNAGKPLRAVLPREISENPSEMESLQTGLNAALCALVGDVRRM